MQSLNRFRYTRSTERKASDYVYITLQCKEKDNENMFSTCPSQCFIRQKVTSNSRIFTYKKYMCYNHCNLSVVLLSSKFYECRDACIVNIGTAQQHTGNTLECIRDICMSKHYSENVKSQLLLRLFCQILLGLPSGNQLPLLQYWNDSIPIISNSKGVLWHIL